VFTASLAFKRLVKVCIRAFQIPPGLLERESVSFFMVFQCLVGLDSLVKHLIVQKAAATKRPVEKVCLGRSRIEPDLERSLYQHYFALT
jgi:hypothetical protein